MTDNTVTVTLDIEQAQALLDAVLLYVTDHNTDLPALDEAYAVLAESVNDRVEGGDQP